MKKKVLFAAIMASLTGELTAGTMGPVGAPSEWSWVATLSGGPSWFANGNTQSVLVEPDVLFTYTSNDNSNVAGNAELFLGVQNQLSTEWIGQLGIEIAGIFDQQSTGDVWVDGSPLLNNYTYDYSVEHGRIALRGKVLMASETYFVQPYINASVGVSRNRAHGFTITPRIFEELPPPAFTSNSRTSFTYTVGAGVQKAYSTNLSAGVGYEFTSLGKANLGAAPGQEIGSGLYSNHIYNHALMFNLTYVR